jgi:hypothetical protein
MMVKKKGRITGTDNISTSTEKRNKSDNINGYSEFLLASQ